jgi:hypothetical protein
MHVNVLQLVIFTKFSRLTYFEQLFQDVFLIGYCGGDALFDAFIYT